MLRSMTGFGRGEYSDGERRFIVEIKTVNHRYIDINVRMPRFDSLEEKIHKLVKKHITRKVDIFITSYNIKHSKIRLSLMRIWIVSLLESMKALSEKFDLTICYHSTILQFPESYTIVR